MAAHREKRNRINEANVKDGEEIFYKDGVGSNLQQESKPISEEENHG